MKLSDIYNQLAYGELRQVVLGSGGIDSTTLGFPKSKYVEVLPLITLGLTELHKRFLLREVTMIVPLVSGQLSYPLVPTNEDLMRVERVYGTLNSVDYSIPLNEIDNQNAIRTPSYNSLLLPDDTTLAPWLIETTFLRVVYRADHPVIDLNIANAAPSLITVELPGTHLQALVWYIASRVTNPSGMSGEFHEGNNYAAKFEGAVKLLKDLNLQVSSDDENTKLTDRGFA